VAKLPQPSRTTVVSALCLLLMLCSCSPIYVIRAGWEEAKILLGRERITEVIESSDTSESLKGKLQLVLAAKEFSLSLGLKPEGSFKDYTDIEREVLIWVLTGSAKTSLSPVTWWFPIVGHVPYKGFFDKDDAIDEAKALQAKGSDVYLRTSAAFSTLGWFDDPLLSTLVAYDDHALVNTVIHEILHNTLWIKNHVSFNESLANFVGSYGARDFFLTRFGLDDKRAKQSKDGWHDDVIYARFLEKVSLQLETLYKDDSLSEEEVLEQREKMFREFGKVWNDNISKLHSGRYAQVASIFNNAVIIAHRIYLEKPWEFVELYKSCDSSLERFIEVMKEVAEEVNKSGEDPYEALQKRVTGA